MIPRNIRRAALSEGSIREREVHTRQAARKHKRFKDARLQEILDVLRTSATAVMPAVPSLRASFQMVRATAMTAAESDMGAGEGGN